MSKTPNNNDTWIVYDGECPFCSQYVKMVRLQEAIGTVRLIDAREDSPERQILQAKGLDLDEGMALHYEGEIYHGDQCIHMLAALTSSNGVFNKLNGWVFKSSKRAEILYPWMRGGRNLALKILGRHKIANNGYSIGLAIEL